MDIHQPLYRRLAAQIRSDFVDGASQPGDQLPTEAEFAKRFGVSRGTIVKAIELLVAERVLVRRQGAGTFVSEPLLRRRQGGLSSFSQAMRALGHEVSQEVLSIDAVSAARSRALGSTEPMILLRRLRFVDGVPVSVHASAVPDMLFRVLRDDQPEALTPGGRSQFSLYAAFEQAGYPIWSAQERNAARLATADEAALLAEPMPLAVMEVNRASFDRSGRLMDATEAIYLSSSYHVEIELARDAAPARKP